MDFFSKVFSPKVEIEVIHAYLNKMPKEVSVSFKKEDRFLIGEIILEKGADPFYVQARTPEEFNKMVNEAVYVALDFKSEYIKFFHERNDILSPSPKARQALQALYEGKATDSPANGFAQAVGFESKIATQNLIPAKA